MVEMADTRINRLDPKRTWLALPATGLADLKSDDHAIDHQQRRTHRLRIAGKTDTATQNGTTPSGSTGGSTSSASDAALSLMRRAHGESEQRMKRPGRISARTKSSRSPSPSR
jgi:hypothetical protein